MPCPEVWLPEFLILPKIDIDWRRPSLVNAPLPPSANTFAADGHVALAGEPSRRAHFLKYRPTATFLCAKGCDRPAAASRHRISVSSATKFPDVPPLKDLSDTPQSSPEAWTNLSFKLLTRRLQESDGGEKAQERQCFVPTWKGCVAASSGQAWRSGGVGSSVIF